MNTEIVENRGVDMVTLWNRCPPNSDLNLWNSASLTNHVIECEFIKLNLTTSMRFARDFKIGSVKSNCLKERKWKSTIKISLHRLWYRKEMFLLAFINGLNFSIFYCENGQIGVLALSTGLRNCRFLGFWLRRNKANMFTIVKKDKLTKPKNIAFWGMKLLFLWKIWASSQFQPDHKEISNVLQKQWQLGSLSVLNWNFSVNLTDFGKW